MADPQLTHRRGSEVATQGAPMTKEVEERGGEVTLMARALAAAGKEDLLSVGQSTI